MRRSNARKAFLHAVFTTALEGGIGYWSVADEYHWAVDPGIDDLDGFFAVVHEIQEDGEGVGQDRMGFEYRYDTTPLRIDADVIARGIQLFTKYAHGLIDSQGNKGDGKAIGADHYWRQFLEADRSNGDDGDFDADVADKVVQFGLFGKLVYA